MIDSSPAKGDSAPLYANRQFAIIGTFNYTDGTSSEAFIAQFNPDTDSSVSWQYSAQVMVAQKAYSSIKIEIAYDYNVNTVYFDGIQLYKEEFGNSYTYDDDGNVTSVVDLQKQETIYEYNAQGDLAKVIQNNKAKMTYVYDDYHNVIKATTAEGIVYEFTYDAYGNNTSVSISYGNSKITSSATYSANGNMLISTKDALEKVTQYGYNVDTNVLEWVQYPEDTEATRTEYSYDSMYRLASATADVDTGYSLDASYTYTEDLLTALETNSTTYNFNYGAFAQISDIKIGSRLLASYTYTDDANRYLEKLTYGNDDYIQYTYDKYGRVTKETYEDGDTVTYVYDNSGALASVTDSATGITTTYYYDFTDRLMKYVESGTNYSHSVGYEYDELNNLTSLVHTINGIERSTDFSYDEDIRVSAIVRGNATKNYVYDVYGRLSQRVTEHSSTVTTETYTYKTNSNGAPSGQVQRVAIVGGDYSVAYAYTYDNNGNITSISDGTNTTSYVYDSANQLIRENNQAEGKTRIWTYDDAGNIRTRKEYAYTTGAVGTVLDTVTYAYGNSTWGDLLTSYDGMPLTYDTIGNLRSDGTWSYSWEHGRELMSMTSATKAIVYTYNADGLRASKTVNGVTHYYVYSGGKLIQERYGDTILDFSYDANGNPYTLTYTKGSATPLHYHYVLNLQGDVIRLVNSYGVTRVTYEYDAWGNITNMTYTDETLANANPLRYRGYYYDQDTGLYYLQSRYYNPTWGRFINGDGFVATGQGILGNNQFSYCCNNPINFTDPTGHAFVGIGVQIELSIGSYTCGIEVIIYWDETVCNGDGPVMAIYVYEGASFNLSSDILKSPDLIDTIKQLVLAIGTNVGTDYDTLMLIELQAMLFDSSASGSVVGIWGYDNFQSTADYTGQFTSYSGSIRHVKGTYSYSDTCCAVAIGATTEGSWALSFGQTYYTEIYSGPLFPSTQSCGGGGAFRATRNNSRFYTTCCIM